MKKILLSIALFFSLMNHNIKAQDKWSLQACINYAIENNIQLKQQELNTSFAKNNWTQSKAAVLPSVNANGSLSQTFGRSVDPFTSDFVETDNKAANFSVSGSIVVFNGFQITNNIKKNKWEYLAALKDLEKAKNDVSLNIAGAYLQILFNIEMLSVAENQEKLSQQQVDRTKVLVEAGSLPKGNLLEMQAQLANDKLQVVNARNRLKDAYLNLKQMLDLDTVRNFDIVIPEIQAPDTNLLLPDIQTIYNEALIMPQIASAEYKLKSAEKSIAIAKGRLSPRLIFTASLGTGFSDARKKYEQQMGDPVPIGYVGTTGDLVYMQNVMNIPIDYPFRDQLIDNQNKFISVSISVPIFNQWQTKTAISNAYINRENAFLQLQLTKNQLYKDIQTAYNDVFSAIQKYKASKLSVEATQASFEYTQKKFNLGLVTSVEYNQAKNNLLKAKSDLLQAKFDYVYKLNILNFYRGLPLEF